MAEESDMVCLPRSQLEDLLERAAEKGCRKGLKQLGLEDDRAAADIRDMRDLLGAYRLASTTALQTFVRFITIGIMALLIFGAFKKIEGGG